MLASPASPLTVALNKPWRFLKRHSQPSLALKSGNPSLVARRVAAAIISTPRTFIPTDRCCTYHFITAASNPVCLPVFMCLLGIPVPLLLAEASTQYWVAYSINLGLAFLISETVCLATPYSSHNIATLVPFSNLRISSSLVATGRALRWLRFTGLGGILHG